MVVLITEKVGFEPTAPFGVTGFQDQLLKPLGHPSTISCKKRIRDAGFILPAIIYSLISLAFIILNTNAMVRSIANNFRFSPHAS